MEAFAEFINHLKIVKKKMILLIFVLYEASFAKKNHLKLDSLFDNLRNDQYWSAVLVLASVDCFSHKVFQFSVNRINKQRVDMTFHLLKNIFYSGFSVLLLMSVFRLWYLRRILIGFLLLVIHRLHSLYRQLPLYSHQEHSQYMNILES